MTREPREPWCGGVLNTYDIQRYSKIKGKIIKDNNMLKNYYLGFSRVMIPLK